jgi:hypothetical protein
MTLTTDTKGAALPAGVIFNTDSNAYWVRLDYSLERMGSAWVLTDYDTFAERRFRSEAAGLAALAAFA